MNYINLVLQTIMLLSVIAMFITGLFNLDPYFLNMFVCFIFTGIANGIIYLVTHEGANQ